jgi:hypothetical protein
MDRFVDADWMEIAAAVVRGDATEQALRARLENDIPGPQVQRKVIGILNRMWQPKETSLQELAIEAANMATGGHAERVAAFEAVAVGTYPYFRQVAENLGRLLRLQGSCSAGEIHRRMFELHGKRSTIDQATSYCFKTMVSWGMMGRTNDRRIIPAAQLTLDIHARRLLDRAANLSRHSVSPLQPTDPLLFPFQQS